jgi:eukaryotic-like serine/threonine-protein kinase
MDGTDPLTRLNAALEGRYHIERELGQGGMATVYLADDLKHERKVALKVLRPELAAAIGAERFLAEIRTTANLQHPHILPLFDSGEADGFLFYVMPYVAGESLREKLDREKQVPIAEAISIASKVAAALHVAHEQGVIHRDIKPANIMVANGEPLVADFGIALAAGADAGSRLTDTGMSIGTPAYMSPEQGLETGQLDRRSDVYSLGCVLFEMLVGDPPFPGSNPMAVLVRKSTEDAPAIRPVRGTVSAALEEAVAKSLARVPADRFATAADFARGLSAADGEGRGSGGRALGGFAKRLVVAAAAIVGIVGGGVWLNANLGPTASSIGSVAILPLENISGEPSQDVLIAVLHDRMIGAFYGVDAITTTPRRSVLPFAEGSLGIAEIARGLRVDAVLEGSMELSGGGVHIRLSLILGDDEREVWTQDYNLDVQGLLGVPGQVVLDVAEIVGLGLSPEAEARFESTPQIDTVALAALGLGDALFTNFVEERPLRASIVEYRRATQLDPNFALAFAKLSYAHTWMWWWHYDRTNDRLDLAQAAAERALSLNPNEAFAHLAEGFRYGSQLLSDSAMIHYEAAFALEPANPEVLLFRGFTYRSQGEWAEAVRYLGEAAELDPTNIIYLTEVAGTVMDLGDLDAADRWVDRALAIRDGAYPSVMKADIGFRRDGDLPRARDHVRTVVDRLGAGGLVEGWNPGFILMLAVEDPVLRSALEARGVAARFFQDNVSYDLLMAEAHQMSGDTAVAMDYYESARVFLDSVLVAGLEERQESIYASTIHSQLGLALAGLGDRESAVREGESGVRRLPLGSSAEFGVEPLKTLARIYTLVGEHELAIDRLQELVEHGVGVNQNYLTQHPWWKGLRGNARFEELIRGG